MPQPRKTETAATLRGIRWQLKAAINRAAVRADDVVLTAKQALRIEEALRQFERYERIQTEPQQ